MKSLHSTGRFPLTGVRTPRKVLPMTKTTKTLDRFDNISYTVERNGKLIGHIRKTCSGYQAEFLNGDYVPTGSIKKARTLIEARA